jgi:hypothetical protein
LWNESVPEVDRELFVDTAESSYEVFLTCSDGSFSGVIAMDSRGYQLEADVLLVHEGFERFGAFMVEALEFWLHSGFASMQSLVGIEDIFGGLVFEGLRKDAVTIVVIEYH